MSPRGVNEMPKRRPKTLDMVQVGTRLPAEYVRVMDLVADAQCTTRSRIIRKALRDFLAAAWTNGDAVVLTDVIGD